MISNPVWFWDMLVVGTLQSPWLAGMIHGNAQMYYNWKRQEAYVQKKTPLVNFPAFLVCHKDTVAVFPALTCLITEQDISLNPNQGFYTIHRACCREYTYYCSSTEGNSRPYSWQTMPESYSCYSHSGNVSAFNGIVNRNAFPRGSEEDWHCCSDCNTLNSWVSHINIAILSQFQC